MRSCLRCHQAAQISTCATITCGRPSRTGSSRAMTHVWSSARTSCARPSTCLSRRSGVPSALGHRGCCSATRLVASTSRAEPADQHGPVRKDTHQRRLRSFFFLQVDVSNGGRHKSQCLRSSSAIMCAFSSVRAHRLSLAPRVDPPPHR